MRSGDGAARAKDVAQRCCSSLAADGRGGTRSSLVCAKPPVGRASPLRASSALVSLAGRAMVIVSLQHRAPPEAECGRLVEDALTLLLFQLGGEVFPQLSDFRRRAAVGLKLTEGAAVDH